MRNVLVVGSALTVLGATFQARATDLWGVRAGGTEAVSMRGAYASATLGATYEFFVDHWGVRPGLDLGLLHYTWGGRANQWILAPELAWYRGDDKVVWRPYLVGQLLLSASSEFFEGVRLGPEMEWRDICESNLRMAFGGFYQPLRHGNGIDWGSFGLRFTVAWGLPTQGCVAASDPSDLP
jgi:hypothetical protein